MYLKSLVLKGFKSFADRSGLALEPGIIAVVAVSYTHLDVYKRQPHTVLKGMNILVDEGIIYKRRGMGMYVQDGAREKVRAKRESAFDERYVLSLIHILRTRPSLSLMVIF